MQGSFTVAANGTLTGFCNFLRTLGLRRAAQRPFDRSNQKGLVYVFAIRNEKGQGFSGCALLLVDSGFEPLLDRLFQQRPLHIYGLSTGTDILTWNRITQTGKVLCMKGDRVIRQQTFQLATASTWVVAAVADFGGDGYSDILLRDASGNLEIVYFNSSAAPTTEDFNVTTLGYSSTASYTAAYGSTSGHFDSNWSVAGTGIFQSLGPAYASIIWVNHLTGQVGITRFTPFLKTPSAGQVLAILPADTEIQTIGDFNADGAKDLLLWNARTSQNTIWYMNFDNGAFYEAGPSLQPSLAPGLQAIPN